MDFKHKVYVLALFMGFCLLYALYPSSPREREIFVVSSADSSLIQTPQTQNLRESSTTENDSRQVESVMDKNEYPKYDANKNEDDRENIEAADVATLAADDPDEPSPFDIETTSENELKLNDEDEEEKEEEEDEETPQNKNSIFVDSFQFNNAPFIKVLPESKRVKYRRIVLLHERYYRKHKTRLYVPRLKKKSELSVGEFVKRFMAKSQPVIIPFDAMRHLNFTGKSFSMDELLTLYPNRQKIYYKYGNGPKSEIDLGPALASLSQDKELEKTKLGRSYPRNMKIKTSALKTLGVQFPKFLPRGTKVMAPSLWFGASSSSTPMHSDCCDNFAMMISGTKRWTIAPPSESRIIKPRCVGGLCWADDLTHPDEHAENIQMEKLRDNTQLVSFELNPGEVLYLPCGWFHHVENIGPTVMVNFWAKDKPFFMQFIENELSLKDLSKFQPFEEAKAGNNIFATSDS